MLSVIISGGQTGVDRAALYTAIKHNIYHGGWCPRGRLAEDGRLSKKYLLKETPSCEYAQRTQFNIRDSEGTLILVPKSLDKIKNGTLLTVKEAREKKKPLLIVDVFDEENINKVIDWIEKNRIEVLNVAGPRESQSPGIYKASLKFMAAFIEALLQESEPCARFSARF